MSGAVGRQSPRLLAPGEPGRRGTRSIPARRSGRDVVKRPLPRSCRAETRIRMAALLRKRWELAGSSRGTGAREVVRVARFDRTHRASSPPGGRKVSWGNEGASQSRARKHRLTRGTGRRWRRNGARRHVFQFRIHVASACRVSARRLKDTKRGVLGSTRVRPLPALARRGPRSAGQHRGDGSPQGDISRHISASGGAEADSGVPAGDNGERQRSTWFGQGSTRTEKAQGESASSTLKRCRTSGAPSDDRPKLATANSFADLSRFWSRERSGT